MKRLATLGLLVTVAITAVTTRSWWQPQLKAWLENLLNFFGGGDNLQGLDSLLVITGLILAGVFALWRWSQPQGKAEPASTPTHLSDASINGRPRNEFLLLQAVKQEVIQSLHKVVFINLDKQSQPQQVSSDAEIGFRSKSPEPLPAKTTILEVFDRPDIAGRLLILGEPGAGKTTTMLDLAKALRDRAEQDANAFIPVLVNLSSWKDQQQPMKDWLVAELNSNYGFSKAQWKQWIENMRLLPLLDGLDEVKSEHQESCVKAINCWLESDDRPPSLAVCCRREEYEKVVRGRWQAEAEETQDETRMHLNGAIRLQALTDEQIHQYLNVLKQPHLWQTLQSDDALLELVRTPLFLSIVGLSVTEQKFSFADWRALTSREARLQYLFDVFWEAAINRVLVDSKLRAQGIQSKSYGKTKPPSAKQTKQWLIFLAQQLQQQSQTEFLLEKIQSDWMSDSMWIKIHLIQLLSAFFILLACIWIPIRRDYLNYPTTSTETTLLGLAVASILFINLLQKLFYFNSEMSLTRHLIWSWKKAVHNFIKSLVYGSAFGVSIGLTAGLTSQLKLEGIEGIILGFSVGYLIVRVVFSKFLEDSQIIYDLSIRILYEAILSRPLRMSFINLERLFPIKHIATFFLSCVWAAAGFWGSAHNANFVENLREGMINGILLGFTIGFILVCTTGWEKLKEIEPSFPNKGVRVSQKYFLILLIAFLFVFVFLIIGIFFSILFCLSSSRMKHIIFFRYL